MQAPVQREAETPVSGTRSENPVTPVSGSEQIDPDEGYMDSRSLRQVWFEYVLLCLCNVAWTIDFGLLPIFFKEFQVAFRVSQTSLSMLSSAKGWTAALFAFPCGFMGELLPRPKLIGMGMISWSLGLLLCAMAGSFETIFIGRVLNGMGLGIVQPLLLSLVADKNPPTKRGSAFGSLFFVGSACNTIFGFIATRYTATTILGMDGWRVSVASIALFSSIVGTAITLFLVEPNSARLPLRLTGQGFLKVIVANMPKVLQLFRYPTFVLILCQGAPGTTPWTVFPFFTQWLQLSCFTHAQSGWIFAAFNWGNAFSNLLSGLLLNFTARRYPDHGPPSIANFSVAIGIPFLVLFFFVLPKPPELGHGGGDVPIYCVAFLMFGLGASMCGIINKKIFADIVPPAIFTYVFAIDQLIENCLGNLAGMLVGVLTDHAFEYDTYAVQDDACAPQEAKKLGMAMFLVCNVAWAFCFAVYLGLHCTYPKDRHEQLQLRKVEVEAWRRRHRRKSRNLEVITESANDAEEQ